MADKSTRAQKKLCVANIETGTTVWEIDPKGASYIYPISDSTVVVKDLYEDWINQNERGMFSLLTAYNIKTGEELWRKDLNPLRTEDPSEELFAQGYNKVIIIKRTDQKKELLMAYDVNTGKELWNKNFAKIDFANNTGDKIFFVNTDSLFCLGFDGNEKWAYKFTEPIKKVKGDFLIIKNNKLFLKRSKSYAFNPTNGKLLWQNDKITWEKDRSYQRLPFFLAPNYFIIQTGKNTIKAYDNGTEKWVYKSNNSIRLTEGIYNNSLFIAIPKQGLLLACNNSEKAKQQNDTIFSPDFDLFNYSTSVFSSVKLPVNGKWMINTRDGATAGVKEFIISEGIYGNKIKTIEWGSWKSGLEDTESAIKSIKSSAPSLFKYNNFHFKEKYKPTEPTAKLVTLKNGNKAVLVESEVKITDKKNRFYGFVHYARSYYFLAKNDAKKARFPIIVMTVELKPENIETEKQKYIKLLDYIANTAVLKPEYKIQ